MCFLMMKTVLGLECPTCKEVLGEFIYSGVYTLVGESMVCPDSCLYQNNMGQHFCFKPGGLQVKYCTDLNSDKNKPVEQQNNIMSTTTTIATTTTTTITTTKTTTTTTMPVDNDFYILGGGTGSGGKSRALGCYGENGRMMDLPLLPDDLVGGVGGVVGDLVQVCGGAGNQCWVWSPLLNNSEWVLSAPYRQLTYPAGISVGGQMWVTGGMMVIAAPTDSDPEPEINLLLAQDTGSGFNPYADMNLDMMKRSYTDPRSTMLYRWGY